MTTDKAQLIARGKHAEQLLGDPLLHDAFVQVEAEIMRVWRDTDAGQVHDRERLWLSLQLLSGVQRALFNVVQTGKAADAEIAALLRPLDAIHTQPS